MDVNKRAGRVPKGDEMCRITAVGLSDKGHNGGPELVSETAGSRTQHLPQSPIPHPWGPRFGW